MFGGQPNTPFGGGGGGFGQPANTAPAFGSPAPAPGGLFGSPAPAPFGAPAGGTAFGGGGGGFGQPAAAPAGGMFGQPAPAPAGGGLFGQPAPAPAFGSTFGAPAPAAGGMFGQPAPAPATGAFGAPAAPFGQPAAAPAPGGLFGGGANTSPFGAPAPAPGAFGAAPAPAFGGGSTFGAPAPTTAFGAPAPSTGLFGAPTPAPAFGAAPAPAGGGLFGSPAPAPAFGGGSTFGAAPAPAGGGLFGAPAPATGGFGAPAAGASPFGGAAGQEGTRGTPFQITTKKDNNGQINLLSITAMQQYENKSFEELRFEDYSQGNKGQASTAPAAGAPAGFGFGAPQPAAPAPSLFGAPAPAPFGAPAPGAFGAPAPGAFGAPAPAPFGAPAPGAFGAPAPTPGGGLFGAPAPTPGGFGAPAPAPGGGLFGAPAPAPFGAPAPAPGGGLFGAPAPTPGGFGAPAPAPGLFGAPAPAPFGAPAPSTGGLFGSPTPAPAFGAAPAPFGAPAPAPGGGLFGAPAPAPFGTPAPAPFGAPAPGGLFGTPAPAPFGAPAPGGLFGQPAPAPLGGGLFGQPAPAPFGAPAPGGLFGQPAPQAPQPAYVGIPQNTIIIPPTADEANMQGIRALLKTKEEMEKEEIWTGESVKSKVSTPTSVSESDGLVGRPAYNSASNKFFPDSAIKIRPRGFPKTESPAKTVPNLATLGRGGADSTLMPPDSNFRSPVMQLTVIPGSLSKPNMRAVPSSVQKQKPTPALNLPEETITSPPPNEETPAKHTGESSAPDKAPTPEQAAREEPSPGLSAYYNQTISSPADPSPVTTLALKKSDAVPILTKDGHETTPPMEELSTYSAADLAAVPNFSVCRPGYGKVEWLGAVDVRYADLDNIVEIEPKDVSVYNKDEQQGTKPEVGTRLNRPAEISYYEVFPKDNPDASAEEKEKFAARLKKNSNKIGADFLGYNKITGEWKIRVQHFSRYAFIEDDSDDDDEEAPPESHATPVAPARQQPKSILHRKATPFKPSKGNITFDLAMSPEESAMTVAKIREKVQESSEKAYAEVFDSKVQVLHSPPSALPMEIDESDEENDQEDTFPNEWEPPTKEQMIESQSKFSITAQLLRKQKTQRSSVDVGFRMGKSFRVAFSPCGSFFVPRVKGSNSKIAVKCPVHGPAEPETEDGKFGFLETHVDVCVVDTKDEEGCPLYSLPEPFAVSGSKESHASFLKALGRFSSLRGNSEEGKSTFKLLAYLVGSGNDDSKDAPRESLLLWLVSECKESVSDDIQKILSKQSSIAAVFATLSGGDIERACLLAADSGFHDLAAVISTLTASGNTKADLKKIIVDSGALPSLSSDLDRLTKAIAGKDLFEDSRHRSGSNGLDWRRRLALRALNSSDQGVRQIVQKYSNDVSGGAVPTPSPYYGGGPDVRSVQFKVLSALSGVGSAKLSDVVQPNGFTPFHNDMAMSFHLAAAVAGAISFDGGSDDFEKVCASYASQLLCEEEWAWAAFVMLCILPGATEATRRRRIDCAKSIVVRYYIESDEGAESSRKFLEEEIRVPSLWFVEAQSNQALTVVEYVSHTLKFDPEAALEVLETRYLPNVFFLSKGQVDNLMGMIEGMANARNSVAAGIVRFFRLTEKLRSDPGIMGQLEDLVQEHDDLLKFFKSRLSTMTNPPGHYRFYVEYPMRVSLPSMLRESLAHLSDVRLQIAALAHDAENQVP